MAQHPAPVAQHPEPGAVAPDFTLRNQHGERMELAAVAGAPVLLMFFPFAFSRVCGSELGEVHRRWAEFEHTGASVLAISCDAVHTLRRYADALVSGLEAAEQPGVGQSGTDHQTETHQTALGPQLLSDFWPHGAAAQQYGVLNTHTGAPQRVSFLLDADLRVRHRIASQNNEPRSVDQTLQLLATL